MKSSPESYAARGRSRPIGPLTVIGLPCERTTGENFWGEGREVQTLARLLRASRLPPNSVSPPAPKFPLAPARRTRYYSPGKRLPRGSRTCCKPSSRRPASARIPPRSSSRRFSQASFSFHVHAPRTCFRRSTPFLAPSTPTPTSASTAATPQSGTHTPQQFFPER
jgi:hypothetical protein